MLSNKVVVVTGAGRGIGRTIAIKCAAQGANLALLARTESELRETQEIVSGKGPRARIYVCDIASQDSAAAAVEAVRHELGRVDVLVNNAGVQPPIGPFSVVSLDEWKKNVSVNLFGTAHMISSVLPDMISRKKGKIINLSGGGSTSPRPNFSAYSVSKTAVVRFTETLAVELREHNIDVNAVSPGAINTRMLDEVLQAGSLAGSETADAGKRKVKGGDDPELAAELIAFLASDDSDGITGKLISAKWDPWKEEAFRTKLRVEADFATLRRVDDKYFFKSDK